VQSTESREDTEENSQSVRFFLLGDIVVLVASAAAAAAEDVDVGVELPKLLLFMIPLRKNSFGLSVGIDATDEEAIAVSREEEKEEEEAPTAFSPAKFVTSTRPPAGRAITADRPAAK
jgi:hypothetical protein